MPLFTMTQLRASLSFYRRYSIGTFAVSALCCVFYALTNDAMAQYATKIITDGAILFFVFAFGGDKLFYYYNLHLTKKALAISFIMTDIFFFTLCLWLTNILV